MATQEMADINMMLKSEDAKNAAALSDPNASKPPGMKRQTKAPNATSTSTTSSTAAECKTGIDSISTTSIASPGKDSSAQGKVEVKLEPEDNEDTKIKSEGLNIIIKL